MKREGRGFAVPLLLAALTAAFFWKILFLGRAIGGLDVLEYFYPYHVYAQQAIDSLRLPLWNPDIFGGVPFQANIQAALFYPFSSLFYLFDEPAAYTWNVVLHVFLGGLFTYLFARQSLTLGRTGALLAAVIFSFGGFLGGQTGHLNQLSAAVWLPALLLCWDKAVAGRLLYVLIGSLVVAIQFLAGHSQESYLMLVVLGLYAVYETIAAWRRGSFAAVPINALGLAVIVALGAALSAAQLIPTLELNSWGIRGNGLTYQQATTFSLKPTMLLQALLPPFWNRAMVIQPGGTEFLGYISIAGIVLALAALIYAGGRRTWFFAALAALALFLAVGKENPVYPLLFKIVPGLNVLRVPARWLFVYSFAAAMLAAIGIDAIAAAGPKRSWRPLAVVLALAAVAGAALSRRQDLPPAGTLWTWLGFGAVAAGLVFSAVRAHSQSRPLFGGAFVVLVVVELWIGAQSLDYNHPTPAALFSQPINTVGFLQGEPAPFRVLSIAQDTYVPAAEPALRQQYGSQLPSSDLLAYLSAYKLREILEPNTGMAAGVNTIDGYDGGLLPLARYVQFKDQLTGIPSAPDDRIRFVIKWLPNRPLLDLAGVRYVITDALQDKTVNGIDYDLSSFIHVDPAATASTLELNQPVQASSIGLVVAVKSATPLPPETPVATLALTDQQGNSRSVVIQAGGGQEIGHLPYSDPLPTRLTVTTFDRPIEVQSATLTLGSVKADVFLNGLALLDAAGNAHSPLVAPGAELRRVFKGDVKIYENPAARPPVFLVHQGQLPGVAPTYDPTTTALVEGNPQPPPSTSLLGRMMTRVRQLVPSSGQPFQIPPSWLQGEPAAPGEMPDTVKLDTFQPERVAVSTDSARAGFLVLTQSFYPGWEVTVDGARQHLLAADGLFQGVYLSPGRHQVSFDFKPLSFTLGAVVSLAACAIWLLGLFLAWTATRARRR